MARKRIIDTEGLYFDTELVQALGPRGLHYYIRLWGIAEDWGGYEYKPAEIALKMGALKFTSREVEVFEEKLLQMGKVIEYDGDGKKIHWLRNFLKNQPLNNPGPPRLPLPSWINCDQKRYESGKTYAKYEVIPGRLPVGYQYHPRTVIKKRNETKRNRNFLSSEQPSGRFGPARFSKTRKGGREERTETFRRFYALQTRQVPLEAHP